MAPKATAARWSIVAAFLLVLVMLQSVTETEGEMNRYCGFWPCKIDEIHPGARAGGNLRAGLT
jgi:hypothetical protein